MKATINENTYDTEKAEEICTDASPDGEDILYRTKDGRFFVVLVHTFLDGVKLRPDEDPYERAPELDDMKLEQVRTRIQHMHEIKPLSDREALVWCVKTQMPDCFRGYVLESI
jgi:hypothetical protein